MNKHKKSLSGIYAITDPELMHSNFVSLAEQAIKGGINILQYRNKSATPEQQEQEAAMLVSLCHNNNVIFIINDNVELAIKVNADGVHLGQKDTDIKQARKQLGKNKIIGISCNNQLKLAQAAQQQGADYIAFGRFFNSQTKPSAPQAELTLLSDAKDVIDIPIVAIGGITLETAPQLLNKDIAMLAIIQGIFGQDDVLQAAQKFNEIFNATNTPKASV